MGLNAPVEAAVAAARRRKRYMNRAPLGFMVELPIRQVVDEQQAPHGRRHASSAMSAEQAIRPAAGRRASPPRALGGSASGWRIQDSLIIGLTLAVMHNLVLGMAACRRPECVGAGTSDESNGPAHAGHRGSVGWDAHRRTDVT
jgi:hypothetical protein